MRQSRGRLVYLRISDAGNEGAGEQWPGAWNLHEASTGFCLPRACTNAPLVLQHLILHDRKPRPDRSPANVET